MFVSGTWRGFWEQEGYGRQPMEAFELHFRVGDVTGHGRDVVGRFTCAGEYDETTGRVRMVKQYLGRHMVLYEGGPDGEGCIHGTWTIVNNVLGTKWLTTGPFVLYPDVPRPTGDEPIYEIKK
ncbi:MAG TPA: hypothetical protein VFG68_12945 [Fimbriiglobus sp.]|nr:hypothetical protein [Fimbriiglobus sp.]